MLKKLLVLAVAVGAGAVFGYLFLSPDGDGIHDRVPGGPLVEIALPATLSDNAELGRSIYETACLSCHGPHAVGQDGVAPPLVHKIYEPSHHADESFQRAVSVGVQAHHWPFGDMPAVEGLTRADVALVTAYIRELQQANGIN
ncbi:cytochrome c [Thalassococcus sp. CAU 1522]|uniref:Cytochrome c n=1 Tax=Thalassococcus arenae TaxID=2851652 RepID=A0ABS6N4T5_9RHOB|nr:cytochrome c [Thalassococcus arenae]MBV2359020.1 cytochrome c [Thalassococcus arenae]